ncbi:zinc-dependent alcohol dehydrogenase family protein [Aspergillus undulatus]|uniref:zinc-dependent alcohol dehydrogenase family protein n=1 Tax=Aspergillus undulatus TaxID=1810928 RepID=UPI003CCDF02A
MANPNTTEIASLSSTPTWLLTGQSGTSSLEFDPEFPLPPLSPHDVLVRIHAASLNYRELAIASGKFNTLLTPPITPSSDGAGEVVQTGAMVTEFAPGNDVVTHLTVHCDLDDNATFESVKAGLGQGVHGTLRKYAVFHESSLMHMPYLSYREAATLTCSGLTAWNALFGAGDGLTVLVQGSGGVSVAALQFALAANATVIATTSSDTKAAKLKTLGAHHIINYKEQTNWGDIARFLTPHSRGVDIIIDVGGSSTISESLKAVRTDGLISLTGLLGGAAKESDPSIMAGLMFLCRTRGVLLGTRRQFKEMNAFIEERGVKPVVDEWVFKFDEVKEAYEYLETQRHFSKVVVDVDYDEGL